MDQQSLFSQKTPEHIDLQGCGELEYLPRWISVDTADHLFAKLLHHISWEQPFISLYGKDVKIPRLQAWYGEPEAVMEYSGTRFKPMPWLPVLRELKEKIEGEFNCHFNSVLANLYRTGMDSVSWHADDEPELGPNPIIASLSFGASRKFQLKPKSTKNVNGLQHPHELMLNHGDLIVMKGDTQKYWQHAILKEKHLNDARINLTFRWIEA